MSNLDSHPLENSQSNKRDNLLKLVIGAMGVVYGDIGTSPLYAIKECFHHTLGIEHTVENVLGILSLIFWALTLVVVVKYLTFVMRADNRGEGGIMALLALITPEGSSDKYTKGVFSLILIGIFGTALLWADGIITPAISVLSAVEGLGVATPAFHPFIVPITIGILSALFLAQRFGSGGVGAVFGPIMLCWFVVIALLGIPWIWKHPEIMTAINPLYALKFFAHNHLKGFLVLGAVVLCVTGAEALYADMGHFGRKPIRFAWYLVVFPGLLLNYFGQGALILEYGDRVIGNPFYSLVKGWTIYPMILLSTTATIIASQALISGAFSLAQQAMQLGYIPRAKIIHTSPEIRGQIYMPEINSILMVACISLVLFFRSSSNLAAAYGISVMGTMTITSVLIFAIALRSWKWKLWKAALLTSAFLCVDLTFLFANFPKMAHGGWVPFFIGIVLFVIMTTWKRGRAELAKSVLMRYIPIETFVESIGEVSPRPVRVEGTGVFMTSNPGVAPPVLLHHLKHNKALHKKVILLTIVNEKIPKVPIEGKVKIHKFPHGFYQVLAFYGFMESPNVHEILKLARKKGLKVNLAVVSYYLARESLLMTGRSKMARWRKWLFIFLSRNAQRPTAFFHIPPNEVIEVGMQIQL
jgi:KUP system potassium uptake protein